MRVLVVKKTTNLELHGARVRSTVAQGHMAERSILKLQASHDDHYQTLNELKERLTQSGIGFDEVSRGMPWPAAQNYDAVVTVGGDGTLLEAGHHLENGGTLIGVRSSESSVGFLCAAGRAQLPGLIDGLKRGRLPTVRIQRLKASISRSGDSVPHITVPVINDFLFTNTSPAATTRYKLHHGHRAETHRSSGIWIATAAGSTAGILAAGGERVEITADVFQYRVRELYVPGNQTYHLCGGRFDPTSDPVVIENRNENAMLAIDGQHGEVDLNFGDTIQFLRAAPVQVARLP